MGYKMNTYTLHIDEADTEINLDIGTYRIDILGGWGVRLNGFGIVLTNRETDVTVTVTKTNLKIQSIKDGHRAIRVFLFAIFKAGTYKLHFSNINALEIKRSRLKAFSTFRKRVSRSQIQIKIY